MLKKPQSYAPLKVPAEPALWTREAPARAPLFANLPRPEQDPPTAEAAAGAPPGLAAGMRKG